MPVAYRLIDVDLAAPPRAVRLSPAHRGVAVVARWEGRPCGFAMHARRPGGRLEAPELTRLAVEAAGDQLVVERLRSELRPAPGAVPLPSVTVAVCTRGRPREVERLLESLGGLEGTAGIPALDLVVVDNAPPDTRTREVVARFAGGPRRGGARALAVRYAVEPLPGLDFARNRAVAEARGDWLVFLDDDVVVEAGWLEGFAEAYRENPDAGAITGLVLPLALDSEAQVLFERRGGFRKGFAKRRFGPVVAGDKTYPCGAGIFGTGANMALRTGLVRDLGGFDEALDMGAALPGGGDVDMFYRVVRSGCPLVYEPAFAVRHEHRRDRAGLRRQLRMSWGTGTTAFAMKVYGTEPPMRKRVRRLLWWWARDQVRRVRSSLTRRGAMPIDLALAEFGGGLLGMAGRYARARRLAARIRADHAAA